MNNMLDNELELLNNNIIKMSLSCENAITLTMNSLFNKEIISYKDVKKIENNINEYEKEIERQCLNILLKQHPYAKDLRMISAVLKIITDLERIGDQACDIADIAISTKVDNELLEQMSKEAIKLLSLAIDSFVKKDLSLAKQAIKFDDKVDDLFIEVKNNIIDILKSENTNAKEALDMLMVAKYLERIADHAVNVSEWVIFSITGLHKGEKYDSNIGR